MRVKKNVLRINILSTIFLLSRLRSSLTKFAFKNIMYPVFLYAFV